MRTTNTMLVTVLSYVPHVGYNPYDSLEAQGDAYAYMNAGSDELYLTMALPQPDECMQCGAEVPFDAHRCDNCGSRDVWRYTQ